MSLVFQQHPDVHIGTLTFRNVPTILQFEDIPLIEVKNTEDAGWSTHFHIFHPDGTPLAVVKGARMFLTEEGKKATLNLRHEPDLIVCELSGQTLFELRHAGASALKAWAELYTPTGILIKASDALECLMPCLIRESGGFTRVGRFGIKNGLFDGCPIAIKVLKDGKVGMWVTLPLMGEVEFQSSGKYFLRSIGDKDIELEDPGPLVKVLKRQPSPFDDVPSSVRHPLASQRPPEISDFFVWGPVP